MWMFLRLKTLNVVLSHVPGEKYLTNNALSSYAISMIIRRSHERDVQSNIIALTHTENECISLITDNLNNKRWLLVMFEIFTKWEKIAII